MVGWCGLAGRGMLPGMRSALHASRPRWLRLPAWPRLPAGGADGQRSAQAAMFEAAEHEATTVEDVSIVIARSELDRLGRALAELLGPDLHRPDTPARLEAALAAAVERLGGSGRPRVTRHPAGLTTPESWQVRLASIEPDVADAIRAATRTGHFATMETR